jgi:hypothetical protein
MLSPCLAAGDQHDRSDRHLSSGAADDARRDHQDIPVHRPKYQGIAGLLRKNYWLSEDGRRAGGIYVWASRADAERLYTAEWKKMVESRYGVSPAIEYLHSPVMVDNRDGTISVAA